MDAQRIEDITEWDGRSFSDGFAGLRRLADRGFSGAATDGSGWLFVLNGRVVGTVDADLDDFADASGTVYKAPEEVLPLLFAMQEHGGEKRAQYYTNDTPLSDADRKLSQGGFTGYVELSENVLSGDYYVTYTAGESRAAAYVGNSRRLETGEQAFDLADDEVGIYTVYEVDLDVREIPEPADASTTGSDETEPAVGDDDEPIETDVTGNDERSSSAAGTSSTDGDAQPGGGDSPAGDENATNGRSGPVDTETARASAANAASSGSDATAERNATLDGSDDDAHGVSTDDAASERLGESHADGRANVDERSSTDEDVAATDGRSQVADTAANAEDEDVFSEEAEWREAKSIPALDPSEASARAERRSRDDGRRDSSADRSDSSSSEPSRSSTDTKRRDSPPSPRSTDRSESGKSAVSKRPSVQRSELHREVQRLESQLEAAESARESLATERTEIAEERDRLESEVDGLEAEVERLESEVTELRSELEQAREELTAIQPGRSGDERLLPAAEARSETNLFIRYDSKGGVTLEDAHDGDVDPAALRENLRIEHHTSFDSDGVLVDGAPFREFLHGTMEYGFTRWLVEELPFEVRDTGNESALRDLYDALPDIDRAEIDGSVSIITREGGEETREQRTFDLVLRDRMGNPLFIAELNDSRDPTVEGTLESLVAEGGDIAESNDSFAGAFAVTASFFEPGALEAASNAVGGGLFGRSKRKSFVKLSRKRGYHLCLVESRDGGFHVTVPDL
ncbi:DUF7527 domain-containing protein [Halorubrum sp. DTA98]|uniref:DUF7527 domain-containing protein n=1 Tax=Halorubrum sp. DTA98 TaxID=3402163 RepID=UPI003AACE332